MAQPSLDTKQTHEKQMKMAMFVGDKRHYVTECIERRHSVQTAERAGLAKFIANTAFQEIEVTFFTDCDGRALIAQDVVLGFFLRGGKERLAGSVRQAMAVNGSKFKFYTGGCRLDTVGVTGSNPVSRTTLRPLKRSGLRSRKVRFPPLLQVLKKSHFLPFLCVF